MEANTILRICLGVRMLFMIIAPLLGCSACHHAIARFRHALLSNRSVHAGSQLKTKSSAVSWQ